MSLNVIELNIFKNIFQLKKKWWWWHCLGMFWLSYSFQAKDEQRPSHKSWLSTIQNVSILSREICWRIQFRPNANKLKSNPTNTTTLAVPTVYQSLPSPTHSIGILGHPDLANAFKASIYNTIHFSAKTTGAIGKTCSILFRLIICKDHSIY